MQITKNNPIKKIPGLEALSKYWQTFVASAFLNITIMDKPLLTDIKRIFITLCIVAGLFLFIRQAYATFIISKMYGGTDLRVRIVGSRLMQNGSNPFVARWNPTLPETLCDPNDSFAKPVNGVTVTPFLLWLQQPLAHLSYPTIRMIWWVAQQMLLLAVISFFIWYYRHSWIAIAGVVLASGALINCPFWFLHADRGQIYVLYAAWITVLFALWHTKAKPWIILTGVWLTIGVLLRPPLAIFAITSFLLIDNKKRGILILCSTISLVLLLAISGGLQPWKEFFSAMNVYTEIALKGQIFPQMPRPAMPANIEGATNINLYKNYSYIIYLGSLHFYFAAHNWRPDSIIYMSIFLVFALALAIPFLRKYWQQKALPTQFLMFASLLYCLAEICQPMRMPYNLIQWLPALAAGVGFIFETKKKQA